MCGVRLGVLQERVVPERLQTKLEGKGWTFGPCGNGG
jgi:hypothetical protein